MVAMVNLKPPEPKEKIQKNKKPNSLVDAGAFPQQHIPLGWQRSPGGSVVPQLLRPLKRRKTPLLR